MRKVSWKATTFCLDKNNILVIFWHCHVVAEVSYSGFGVTHDTLQFKTAEL